MAPGEIEGRAGNGSKIIPSPSLVHQHINLPPEILLNCATILCSIHSFLKTGTIYLGVKLRFNILLFIDHIEIFIKKHYSALSVPLNLFEINMVL